MRSAPACGCRGRWGTSTAQDYHPGRGLHSPHGKQYDSGLSGFTRVELEGAPASPFNCGWVLDAERRDPQLDPQGTHFECGGSTASPV